MRLSSRPDLSRASKSSQSVPQMTLMTFQPAPRNKPFQFLDDFAVAAHRAVEPLQIAVDDPDQIVEVLARRERDGAERFRLVAFAVAEKRPDFRLFLPVHQAARLQVTVEPRLIQRHDRAEAHRDRRELPEIRHQIRMRIRRQPAAFGEFLPEILQMLLVQPAFEKRPRIHARRGVALKINEVAGKIFRAPAEEMVERHLVKRRRRGERRDVAADVRGGVGLDHHRHRVPADDALDAALDVAVARKWRLLLRRNRVDVRRVDAGGGRGAARSWSASFSSNCAVRSGPWLSSASSKTDCSDSAPFVAVAAAGMTGCAGTRTVNFFFVNLHCVIHFF